MNLFRKKPVVSQGNVSSSLAKCLTASDLTLLGIGAILGAGIFVLTGVVAATSAGPAIIVSFILSGLACAFAALSYAELAASLGGCGSAFGYAYAGFGEIIAWIVGWDLLLEYSLSAAAVSSGWGGYFNDLLLALNIHLPTYLLHTPSQGGIINILPVIIIFLLTCLLIAGIKSSAHVNNMMVFVKLMVIVVFILIASTEVNVKNWSPFMPFGWKGIINGASLIFFAYIGFDAVSTAAEEALRPQRDLPVGIIGSLLVCTSLYILVSGLLTLMISYRELNVPSPISEALLLLGYKWAAGLISIGAIAGLSTVMLVLFFGLSRIFYAMARDGLLPSFFSRINKKTQTPVRVLLLAGSLMALMGGLVPIDTLAELVNIGTLFAFIIVCAGVLILRKTNPNMPRPFKTPWMPLTPILGILSCSYLICHLPWVTLLRFVVWMIIGFVIYFSYSYSHSKLGSISNVNPTKQS